jgi:serine/threonine protein phosphatase PrpC
MFMITGSDGVFEFMSSQEMVELVKNYYLKNDIKGCAEFLIEESSKRWMRQEEIIDDITVIIVFFE